MEAGDRDPAATLSWREYRDAAPNRFFGLVAFLERVTAGASPVGAEGPIEREAIRFRHDPDLSFHPADVRSVRITGHPERFEVTTTFLGLSGTASPLPPYISEGVMFDTFERGTQRDFLDVFHHRTVSLLYRSVIRLDPARQHRADATDPWQRRLLSLAGVRPDPSLALEVRHLMVLIPVLLKRSRGADALRVAIAAVLRDELPSIHVRIRELAGQWLDVDADQHTLLGSRNHRLGDTAVLGRRVYDRRGRFAVRIGVLSRAQADLFADGQRLLDRLRGTVRLVVRDPLEYDLELELDEDASETVRLGSSRLGRARLTGFHGHEVVTMRNVGERAGINRSRV